MNQKNLVAGLIVVVALIAVLSVKSGASDQTGSRAQDQSADREEDRGETQIQSLGVADVKLGEGREAEEGDLLSVHYTGRLEDGTKFDSSLDRGRPFDFPLGAGFVIKGWDQALVGMKKGGIRKFIVPPELGYGDQAVSNIPANSRLIFEVELIDIK